MNNNIYFSGGGGGEESSRTSAESPDTLRSKSYVKVVDLLGEGEFEEVLVGGLTGLLLDDVPVQNQDGSLNFTGINVETRNGTLGQSRMSIGSTVESTVSVGVRMMYASPVEQAITASETDILRVNIKVPSLTSVDSTTGDISGTTVQYKIEWKENTSSSWNTVNEGTWQTFNNTIVSNVSTATFSGYTSYTYTVTITSWSTEETFVPSDSASFTQIAYKPTTYYLQTNTNNAGWVTVESGYFSGINVLNKAITSSNKSDVISIRILLTEENPWGGVILYQRSFANIDAVVGTKTEPTGIQTISGKSSSAYEKQTSFRISGNGPWTVRCTRLTSDSTKTYINDQTIFSSVTSVLEERLRYPGSVLVGMQVDAEQFSSVPSRSFLCKGLKVKVPTNYDPISRFYSGTWDGSFKIAWTDNPAWCFYDLLTNTRYGLGDRITESSVDKATLYEIAKYCDELVPGDNGVAEPRFTCNLVIQTKEQAYQLLNDFASIFRGVTYWAAGRIVPVQDSPKTPRYAFNNTNVEGGVFTYQSTDISTRYNAVSVTWINPNNYYKREVEYVDNQELISQLGYVNETPIVAFGCTSRGMARRVGKWLIYTNNYQTDSVSFTTGAEGSIPLPGDVIKISDTLRAQERRGGRLVSATTISAVLDKPLSFLAEVTYTFTSIGSNGELVETTFNASGLTDTISFLSPLQTAPTQDAIFIIADSNVEAELFKIVSVSDKGEGKYDVLAVSHNESKYANIEQSIPLVNPIDTGKLVYPVVGIDHKEYLYADGTSVKNKCVVSWEAPKFAIKYIISIRQPDDVIVRITEQQPSYTIFNAVEGVWGVSITAVNILGQQSQTFSQTLQLYGTSSPPAGVENFSVRAKNNEAVLQWSPAPDLDVVVGGYIVIAHSQKTSGASWQDAILVAKVPGGNVQTTAPLMGGTYMAKAIDSSGKYSIETAYALADFALVQQRNVLATIDEHPTFLGEKENTVVIDNMLTLSPMSRNIDESGYIDTWGYFDYLDSGAATHGVYYFNNIVDLGESYSVQANAYIEAYSSELQSLIDSRVINIDEWTAIDTLLPNLTRSVLYISSTNDDPASSSAIWSGWTEFMISEYVGRGFRFKLELTTESSAYTIFVKSLSVSMDAKDRTDSKENVTCPTTGVSIVFSPAFISTPAIAISIDGMQDGDYYEKTAQTNSGFTLKIMNSGIPVERQFDWIAKGHGYKTT